MFFSFKKMAISTNIMVLVLVGTIATLCHGFSSLRDVNEELTDFNTFGDADASWPIDMLGGKFAFGSDSLLKGNFKKILVNEKYNVDIPQNKLF